MNEFDYSKATRFRIGKPPRLSPSESRRPPGIDPMAFRLDWWGYWEEFKRRHGPPVDLGWRLCFPDGWTYARHDPRGPEFPPPAEPFELMALLIRYWVARLRLVEDEARRLREVVENLRTMQHGRGASLQGVWRVRDEETGRVVPLRRAVDPDDIEAGRLAMLENDAADCRARLTELAGW